MVFSSLLFLFRFLPAVLLLYFLSPRVLKNTVLFVMSLIFYAWGEPVYVILMLFSTVVDYTHGLLVSRFMAAGHRGRARWTVISSIIINLGLLGFFKYSGFLIDTVNMIFNTGFVNPELPLPVGISFYTFQTMSYTIDVYRGEAKAQRNILSFGCYVAMFPQLIAGPIVQFKTIAGELWKREETAEDFAAGIHLFLIGLGKKVLLANNAGMIWDTVSKTVPDQMSVLSAWLGILAFAFQIYFDFSGYSDMAIGLGRMFGFHFLKNFDYPYVTKSITQFWRHWHISLGQWFRDYVYIPLGGNRRHGVQNILIVWFLTGLWHGASFNFLLWGLYYGVFLLLEKFVLKKWLSRMPGFLSWLYTAVIVLFGWVLFACEDLGQTGAYVLAMFSGQAVSDGGIYLLYTNLVLLLCLILGSTPLPARAAQWLCDRLPEWGRLVLKLVFYGGIFVASLAYLVDATYNPFLYFRF